MNVYIVLYGTCFLRCLLRHSRRLLEKVPQESPCAASARRRPAAAARLPPFSSSTAGGVGAHRHELPIVILHRPGHIPFGPKIHKQNVHVAIAVDGRAGRNVFRQKRLGVE